MKYLFLLTLCLGVCFINHAMATPSLQFDAIIGGSEVKDADPISNTTILLAGKEHDGTIFLCTGSIIDTDLILTAAHCTGSDGKAAMAAVFRLNINEEGPMITIADREISNEYWSRAGVQDKDWNDLAVLRLSKAIPAGYEIAKLQTNKSAIDVGSEVILAGYGMNIPVQPEKPSDPTGSGTLRKVSQTVIDPEYSQTEFLISLENNRGSCHGDSGGPALLKKGKEYIVTGVASRMTEKDRIANNQDQRDFSCSKEMVYTSVAAQSDWIIAASKKLHSRK